ncbi:MAG: penicillin-binding protein 1C [Cytophagales bacterium]|nr:penicillin-binding protein 1C [Cytophagales bacterium]
MVWLLVIAFILIPLPNPVFDEPYATVLRASDGQLLATSIAPDEQWRFAPTDSIPAKFKKTILLYEDEYFYQHPGVNPVSIARAISQNIKAGKVISGGSTLTMQVIRMALGNQQRTYLQKVKEILLSFKLELLYSKSEILKLYADHAPFGANIVGLNAASWRYYGRDPGSLSWAEMATLAVLPNDPRNIFPGKNNAALIGKRDRLLQKLHERGYLDVDELFLSKHETLPQSLKRIPYQAPHLLQRVAKDGLAGQNVVSTLDHSLQLHSGEILDRHSQKLAGNEIHNAAVLILDINTGHALAYHGNTNNPGIHGQHVDVITAQRSPGSLLKPFLYATALDEGLILPQQLLPDVPLFYKGFAPKNFDKAFRGAVPANEALSSSLNVPFVHLLIDYGYEKFHQKLKELGFKSFQQPASHYGLSIILGGAETSLWEISSVYAGLARSLHRYSDRPYRQGYSTTDYHPNAYLSKVNEQPESLLADGPIRVASIQHTLEAMRQLRRPENQLGWQYFDQATDISWKTGTSYGFRDAWAIGFNQNHLVGVWVGNADGEGRPGLTGVTAAAPILFDLFDILPVESYEIPQFGQPTLTCSESGMIATIHCPNTSVVMLTEKMKEMAVSDMYHRPLHLNDELTYQVNSSCYPVDQIETVHQFILPPTQAWYYKKYHPKYKGIPPMAPDCTETGADLSFALIYPRQFTKVFIPKEQDGQLGQAIFEAAHQDKNATIHWHIDDQYLGSTSSQHQMGIQAEEGPHLLTLIDQSGREVRQRFEVIN